MIDWNNVWLVKVKLTNKRRKMGGPNLDPKLGFSPLLKFASLLFLDITQDCSLEQSLTSNRAETSNSFVAQIGTKTIFSIVMLSKVQSNLLDVLKTISKCATYDLCFRWSKSSWLLQRVAFLVTYVGEIKETEAKRKLDSFLKMLISAWD